MIELIIGILSTLVPMILNLFSDKLDNNSQVNDQELENEMESLYNADNEIDVAVAWVNHDDSLSALLQEASAQEADHNSC